MKNTKNSFFTFIVVIALIQSCVGQSSVKKKDNATSSSPDQKESSNGGSLSEYLVKTDITVKNFNQYNMSLSKLTGIHRSRVNETFNKIKSSLPSGNNASLFNSFTQISFTRLASTYCSLYINETNDFNFGIDSAEVLSEKLKSKFLDIRSDSDPEDYRVLDETLESIFANELNDSGDKYVTNPNKIKLTNVACVVILSSTFITLM